jgi:hypothetical protein
MATTTRPVRVHWWLSDGRPLCLYDGAKPRRVERAELAALPYCGACLILLVQMRLHSPRLFQHCERPDLRPSESIALLVGTPWAGLFSLDRPAGDDTWWYERETLVS